MAKIGKVVSVWRYPVKGMRGEVLTEAFFSYAGLYGDRLYAFRSADAPAGFPYHTAREQEDLLLYQPSFRSPAKAAKPPNLEDAVAIAPGITPIFADRDDLALDVVGPDGRSTPIDSAALLRTIKDGLDEGADVRLVYSERPQTDCRPVSIFNVATADKIGDELGLLIDMRRFRANMYIELDEGEGFSEENLVGQSLKIGDKVVLCVIERDPRCKMIALDPETGEHNPRILQHVSAAHDGHAGLFAAVLTEGIVRPGDSVETIDMVSRVAQPAAAAGS